MVQVTSSWANKPIPIDGVINSAEWDNAGKMDIPAGYLMVKNDNNFLYLTLDMVLDKGNDVGIGDYFWVSFDVNGNKQITPYKDINYGVYRQKGELLPDQQIKLGRQFYLEQGLWTTILNEPSPSAMRMGFGGSPSSSIPHRIWEMRLSLKEIGVTIGEGTNPAVWFGVMVSSTNPSFTYYYPLNFYANFQNLHKIILATSPKVTYPPGTAGAVIGGVGLIPAGKINDGGYATTASDYSVYVVDAAFGENLHLLGNNTLMQSLWNQGAKKYKILHREGKSGEFKPIRQSWVNYHNVGSNSILESYGPDAEDKYTLLNPFEDYSIDDLLLVWQSVGFAKGIHQFQAQFFKSDGGTVAVPSQILTLMLDNNPAEVEILEILHKGLSIPSCSIVKMEDKNDGVQLRIKAFDTDGLLESYALYAYYGDNQHPTIFSDTYANYVAKKQWNGETDKKVPEAVFVPTTTCAYQFRLAAVSRITNGYYHPYYNEDNHHVTLITPSGAPVLDKKFSGLFPLGFAGPNKIAAMGKEAKKLGAETPIA